MEVKILSTLQNMITTSHTPCDEIIAYIQYYHEVINKVQFVDEEMNTILHWTVQANRLSLCTFLLNKKSIYCGCTVEIKIDPITSNMRGKTALHLAAELGYTRIVVLLASCAPTLLHCVDHVGHSAFYYALIKKHFATAKVMASQLKYSWTEYSQRDGNFLIQSSILQGNFELFEFLIHEAGDDILLQQNNEGMNAFLTSACVRPKKSSNGIQQIWVYLLKHYFKQMKNSVDFVNRNILHFACLESNHLFLELFAEYISVAESSKKKSLFPLKKKCTLETMYLQCDTVFHQCPLSIAIARGDVCSFKILVPHIRNWNDQRFSTCFTSIVSIETSKVSLIAQFVLNQILNATNNPTSAPLSNLIEIAKVMIRSGAKMNLENIMIDL